MKYTGEIIAVVIILICAGAFLLVNAGAPHEWIGSDEQAETAIQELSGGYEPWAIPLFVPPSGEIESLLFSIQAALGALVIGFFFGYYYRGRKTET
jgi:cobalt/nickel transport protein